MLLSEPETISTYELIHQLELNGTSTLEVIRAVLRSRYYYDFASSLQGREAEIFIDVLDRVSNWKLLFAVQGMLKYLLGSKNSDCGHRHLPRTQEDMRQDRRSSIVPHYQRKACEME